jgi:hypothetical protein
MSYEIRTLNQSIWHIEWISPPCSRFGGKGNSTGGGRNSRRGLIGPPEFSQEPSRPVFFKRLGLALFHTPTGMLCVWYLPAVLIFVVLCWLVFTLLGTTRPDRASGNTSELMAMFFFVTTAFVCYWLKQNTWYGSYYDWTEQFLTWL